MVNHHRLLLTLALAFSAVACSPEPVAPESTPEPVAPAANSQDAINEFFADFTDRWVEANPNLAVSSGFFTGEKQEELERQLTSLAPENRLQQIERARNGLAELAALDFSAATDTQRLAADLMRWQLELLVEDEPYLDWIDFPLEQMNGASVSLPNQLTVVHPLLNAGDAGNYVARLRLVDDRMREATADARARAERGIVPPDFILQTTIAQMERFIEAPAAENPLVTTLAEKSAALGDLTPERRDELLREAAVVVETEVYPAWQEAVAVLRNQLPLATADAGLWRFPNGAEVYAHQLRRFTTTNLSADEIHAIGLAEVARIEAEMEVLFRQIGLVEGSINERVDQLDARLAYPDNEAGRTALMNRIQIVLDDAQLRSAALFATVPMTPVIAQPYPRFRWENAAASYTAPPLDGARPGIFQMPLRASRLTEFGLRSLVYHETVPGHHFQIALVNENTELPRFMRMRALGGISAISEGWALYAERLAAESGWYEGDVEGLIGQLYSALWRARRLVVDTGLHAKGWTRQQAIDYGIEPSEVERYIVNPGQACSYMIGQLKLVELREKARTALGERFAIQDYHDVVLGAGIVPLTMLEGIVDRYIASVLAASP